MKVEACYCASSSGGCISEIYDLWKLIISENVTATTGLPTSSHFRTVAVHVLPFTGLFVVLFVESDRILSRQPPLMTHPLHSIQLPSQLQAAHMKCTIFTVMRTLIRNLLTLALIQVQMWAGTYTLNLGTRFKEVIPSHYAVAKRDSLSFSKWYKPLSCTGSICYNMHNSGVSSKLHISFCMPQNPSPVWHQMMLTVNQILSGAAFTHWGIRLICKSNSINVLFFVFFFFSWQNNSKCLQ